MEKELQDVLHFYYSLHFAEKMRQPEFGEQIKIKNSTKNNFDKFFLFNLNFFVFFVQDILAALTRTVVLTIMTPTTVIAINMIYKY